MKKTMPLFATLLALAACTQEPITFDYNLAQGDTYSQHSNINMLINQNYNGKETNVEMDVLAQVDFTVNEVLEDTYNMTCTYVSMSMAFDINGQKMSFSSDDGEDEDIFGAVMMGFLGKSFNMTLSRRGEVLTVDGFREILRGVIDNLGDKVGYEEKMATYEQLNKAFGEEALRQSFESNMQFMPKGPVKKGDTWENEFFLSQNDMDMVNNVTYTFLGKSGNNLKLKGEGTVSSAKDNLSQNQGSAVALKLNGKYTQEITLDAETGWVQHSRVVMDAEGENIYKQGGQEMKIPLSMTIRTTISDK